MTNITIKVVKKKLLHIINKNKEMIKKRETHKYSMMSTDDRNKKKRKSLERHYKLKAQYKE